jgi:hypothetical protein
MSPGQDDVNTSQPKLETTMRLFAFSAVIAFLIALLATMAVHPTPANAVTYCKSVGVPKGCVMRGAAPQAELCPVVQLGPDGSIIGVIACDLGDTYTAGRLRPRRTAVPKRK